MKFISTLLMFFGYVLVYAATAGSGKFATDPWLGLFADAYTESTDAKKSTKPEPGTVPSTVPSYGGQPSFRTGLGQGRKRRTSGFPVPSVGAVK